MAVNSVKDLKRYYNFIETNQENVYKMECNTFTKTGEFFEEILKRFPTTIRPASAISNYGNAASVAAYATVQTIAILIGDLVSKRLEELGYSDVKYIKFTSRLKGANLIFSGVKDGKLDRLAVSATISVYSATMELFNKLAKDKKDVKPIANVSSGNFGIAITLRDKYFNLISVSNTEFLRINENLEMVPIQDLTIDLNPFKYFTVPNPKASEEFENELTDLYRKHGAQIGFFYNANKIIEEKDYVKNTFKVVLKRDKLSQSGLFSYALDFATGKAIKHNILPTMFSGFGAKESDFVVLRIDSSATFTLPAYAIYYKDDRYPLFIAEINGLGSNHKCILTNTDGIITNDIRVKSICSALSGSKHNKYIVVTGIAKNYATKFKKDVEYYLKTGKTKELPSFVTTQVSRVFPSTKEELEELFNAYRNQ